MADTIGDVFGRGYRSGRAIGEDFSSMRYQRGERKIREKYAEQAKSEGKTLQDYLPQIETELDDLYTKSGARKRGVTGEGGLSLSEVSRAALGKEVQRAAARRAGSAALGGDIAGSRRELAGAEYAMGNYDTGMANQQGADTIAASTAAINPDGTFNRTKGAQGLSNVQARYGDVAGAAQSEGAREGFRFEAAAALAGQMATMVDNPSTFGNEIRGKFAALKEYVPELAPIDIQVDNGGKLITYVNGKPDGSLDSPDEIRSLLNAFSRDPKAVLGQWAGSRLQEAQIAGERSRKFEDDQLASARRMIEDFSKAGVDAGVVESVQQANKQAQNDGWKQLSVTDDGIITAQAPSGQLVKILPGTPAGPNGEPATGFRIVDELGNDVQQAKLGAAGQSLMDYAVRVGQLQMEARSKLSSEQLMTGLRLLNSLGGGGIGAAGQGGGNSRADRNNNPGNIEDRGQFKGNPDYLGSDGRFARFRTPEAGAKAMGEQLLRYMQGKTTGQPLTSVQDIVGTWSPQTDPTNQAGSTANYANYVARRLGVDPTAPLTPADIPRLQAAMAEFERGGAVPTGNSPAQTRTAAAAPKASPVRTPAAATQQATPAATLLQRRDQMLSAQQEAQRWQEELAQFDRERGTRRVSAGDAALPGHAYGGGDGLSAQDRRLRERIAAEAGKAQQKFDALLGMVRQGTRTLNERSASRGIDDQFAQIQARVAGRGGGGDTAATNPAGNDTLNALIGQRLGATIR